MTRTNAQRFLLRLTLCLIVPLIAHAQDVAIAGATLIDRNGGPALDDAVIMVSAGRISAVGPRASVRIPAGATVIDAAGHYVVPGFIDTNAQNHPLLFTPDAPEMNQQAPNGFKVRLETSKGPIVLELHRDWAPIGVDHFYNLIRAGYYDDDRFFRVVKGRWAQSGINGDPRISKLWRTRTIPDDPRRESNVRGTIAYAFAVPNGRSTQIFINLQDNAKTHDVEPFTPIGKVIEGMEIADALYSEYGETSGRRNPGW